MVGGKLEGLCFIPGLALLRRQIKVYVTRRIFAIDCMTVPVI